MGIQQWSDNIILVNLSQEQAMSNDLDTVAEMVRERGNYNVVIDFSDVDTVTSSVLSKLLKLHEPLTADRRRLVLCGITAAIKGILMVTNLDTLFEIVDDKFTALATLEMMG
jgi:anti-anti-sigma factor